MAIDEVSYTFDAEAYPPLKKPEKTIRANLRGTGCTIEFLVDGKPIKESLTVGHGEYVLAIKATATDDAPVAAGETMFGDFVMRLDPR